jgi:hypothetical protein
VGIIAVDVWRRNFPSASVSSVVLPLHEMLCSAGLPHDGGMSRSTSETTGAIPGIDCPSRTFDSCVHGGFFLGTWGFWNGRLGFHSCLFNFLRCSLDIDYADSKIRLP